MAGGTNWRSEARGRRPWLTGRGDRSPPPPSGRLSFGVTACGAGANNGTDRAFLIVIDPMVVSGCTPAPPSHAPTGVPEGLEKYYIEFPRSDLGKVASQKRKARRISGPLRADDRVGERGQGPVDDAHDVPHADLLGGPTQPIAALPAPTARDDAGVLERDQDALQKLLRDRLGLR